MCLELELDDETFGERETRLRSAHKPPHEKVSICGACGGVMVDGCDDAGEMVPMCPICGGSM